MTEPLRVLVVDDEAPARAKVKRLLAADDRFTLAGEAADGLLALEALEELRPDLLILDVQMPGLSGFEVLEALGAELCPPVIFSTAHDAFALRAFEHAAVDYLLKPYDAERFHRALERAHGRSMAQAPTPAPMETLLAETRKAPLTRLLVRAADGGGGWAPVALDQVIRLSAENKYVRLYTASGEHRLRQPLAELEARLDPRQFCRVHRGEIVRLAAVTHVEPASHGDALLVLENGNAVLLSRTYREAFLERFGVSDRRE